MRSRREEACVCTCVLGYTLQHPTAGVVIATISAPSPVSFLRGWQRVRVWVEEDKERSPTAEHGRFFSAELCALPKMLHVP